MQMITPFLCFDGKAEEAALLCLDFHELKDSALSRYGEARPGPKAKS